jgi:hypothetical protein
MEPIALDLGELAEPIISAVSQGEPMISAASQGEDVIGKPYVNAMFVWNSIATLCSCSMLTF